MDQEKIPVTPVAAEKEKVFDSQGLENKSHDEQILHIDDALAKLGSLSEDVDNALARTEIDRTSEKKVIENSSLFNRVSLKLQEHLRGKEAYKNQLNKMAEKAGEKELSNLERGQGAELIALKEKITKHDADSKNDLDAINDLAEIYPDRVEGIKSKLADEKKFMEEDEKLREQDLESQISGHPAFQKQETIKECLDEYGAIEKTVKTKRQGLESQIRNFEARYNKMKDEDAKQLVGEHLATLKTQYGEIKEREETVKNRINSLKAEKQDLDPFVKRLNSVGKTKKEILEENSKKNKTDKDKSDAKGPAGAANFVNRSPDVPPAPAFSGRSSGETAAGSIPYEDQSAETKTVRKSAFEEEEGDITERLANMSKSATSWAMDIKKIAPALVGKDIVENFNKKISVGNIDGLAVVHVLAQFFVEKKTIKNINKATAKAREIIEQLSQKTTK